MKYIFLIFFLLFCADVQATETTETVKFIKVIDGDTIKIIKNDKKINVRLLKIDCYKTKDNKRAKFQADEFDIPVDEVIKRGNLSKQALVNLLANQEKIIIKWAKYDFFKRILADVYLLDGQNVNEYMMTLGGCFEYKKIKKKK